MYIITYIFIDYINMFINRLSRKALKNFIIIGFIVFSLLPFLSGLRVLNNDAFNFYSFIYLYIIGDYLRLYPLKDTYHFKRLSIKNYRLLLLFIFCFMFFLNYLVNQFAYSINGTSNIMRDIANKLLQTKTSYVRPFVIIQTIAYFEIFNTFRFKNKIVNFISADVLGIYLLHDHPIIRENIYQVLRVNTAGFVSAKK